MLWCCDDIDHGYVGSSKLRYRSFNAQATDNNRERRTILQYGPQHLGRVPDSRSIDRETIELFSARLSDSDNGRVVESKCGISMDAHKRIMDQLAARRTVEALPHGQLPSEPWKFLEILYVVLLSQATVVSPANEAIYWVDAVGLIRALRLRRYCLGQNGPPHKCALCCLN